MARPILILLTLAIGLSGCLGTSNKVSSLESNYKTFYFNSSPQKDIMGLRPGQTFNSVIQRFRSICSECRISKEVNEYWTLYGLHLKADLVFISVSMRQDKGIACAVRYVTLNDVDAAKALLSDAGRKFGPRSSQSYSDPRIQLEYHVDLTSASIGIHGDRICNVKVNL